MSGPYILQTLGSVLLLSSSVFLAFVFLLCELARPTKNEFLVLEVYGAGAGFPRNRIQRQW